eukprot:m.199465 g.199465  ORF g.199465 m.199465 type:complete len:295 (+) comp32735_c1_seq1:191-1075(+)
MDLIKNLFFTPIGLLMSVSRYILGTKPQFLDGKTYMSVKLIEKEEVTHDVRRLRFQLTTPKHVLGLPVGKHIFVKATLNGKIEIRSYTPVTMIDEEGYFDLVLKIYFPLEPRFPEGGKMSQHLNSLNIGDEILVQGPTGTHTYRGNGKLTIEDRKTKNIVETREAKHIGLIAGGTGVTPMMQIIRHVLSDPNDKTQLSLVFANQTTNDILLRDELETFAKDDRFSVWFTVDRLTEGEEWKYSTGFISEEMLKEHLPPAGPTSQVLMCGPPPMIKFACVPNLEKLGYTDSHYLVC